MHERVGTGEGTLRGNVSQGDGVWRSVDAGRTWSHVGLPNSRTIPRIAIDPRDPDTVLVAALGDAFAPGEDRGVYRSTDGGIQRHIDLHGLRTDEARETLGQFLREAHQQGVRCVRVVHGKGLGSPGRTPVLKGRVLRWLVQKNEVMVFVQARPAQGGAGALLVLLSGG